MASLLRQIVAGPRAPHPEANLDLCYVTKHIIATSGPSQSYPKRAYRTPLDRLVGFLDSNHGENWAIWEFRAEGTGYPDDEVYNRIRHYPWPDHHPPPFRLIPLIVAGMRNWLDGGDLDGSEKGRHHRAISNHIGGRGGERVIVVHCKAGKGRSGTSAVSFLVAEEGWDPKDALARFTERRMRPRFGAGLSIPSQLRTISYVDRWANAWKTAVASDEERERIAKDPTERRKRRHYVDRAVEVVEVQAWGLRNGVKLEIAGFADEGKRIEVRHAFAKEERIIVEGDPPGGAGVGDMVADMVGYGLDPGDKAPDEAELAEATNPGVARHGDDSATAANEADDKGVKVKKSKTLVKRNTSLLKRSEKKPKRNTISDPTAPAPSASSSASTPPEASPDDPPRAETTAADVSWAGSTSDVVEPGGKAVVFRPASPIRIDNSDVLVRMERRSRAPWSIGLTMVTATAHVWFNPFFEGDGPERMAVGEKPSDSGVFAIDWEAMDGVKGSSRKGARAVDRIEVVWRVVGDGGEELEVGADGKVPQMRAADWHGTEQETVKEAGEMRLGTIKLASDVDVAGNEPDGQGPDGENTWKNPGLVEGHVAAK